MICEKKRNSHGKYGHWNWRLIRKITKGMSVPCNIGEICATKEKGCES